MAKNYNSDLQTNNNELQNILDTINELPEATEVVLQSKTIIPAKVVQEITVDEGYTALEKVTVEAIPTEYIIPSGSQEITENGEYDVTDKASVSVNVEATGGSDDTFIDFIERRVTEFQSEDVTKVSQYTCYGYTTLTSIDFPNLTAIQTYAFNGCTGLTSFIAPSVTSIGVYGFYNVANLTSINFPEMKTVGNYAFRQCRKITTAMFPRLTSIGTYALSRCNVLHTADLGSAPTLQSNLFAEDSKLKTIILRKTDAITALSAVNVFTSTPFASGGSGGTAYVPQALIETYQTATNWSTLYTAGTCTFLPIEGSQYE